MILGIIFIGAGSIRIIKGQVWAWLYIAQACCMKGFGNKDIQNGEGTLIWPSGDYYTGDWVDGKMHGQG